MDTGIYIPSYRRSKSQQETFLSFAESKILRKHLYLVVDKRDAILYRRKFSPGNVIVCPEDGISKTRQWIINSSKYKYVAMFDDDMSFGVRKGGKIKQCSTVDLEEMIFLLESWIKEGFVHVGISQRFGNNRVEEDFVEVTRMNNAYAYDAREMRKLHKSHGIGFDELEVKYNRRLVMEDFNLTLRLLRLGKPNRVSYKYCWGQRQSGDEGGCSLYRNDEMQKASAEIIAKEHFGLCRVVEKESKTQWRGFASRKRFDLNISWKKAYKTRKRSNGITKFFGSKK
jgi:hypothetical protein